MSKGETLGEFEHLILLAIFRLGEDAYGMRVRREIAERTKRDVTIGAVYSTLDRLAGKGLVKSALHDPTPERGGRAKRCFQVTGLGVASLNRARRELGAMREGIAFPLSGGAR
jgi:DNA-binding PadR family transcriptional regulator